MSNDAAHHGTLFIVAAPSGGGKTSLIRGLLELDAKLALSVSHTTRPARPGEEDGKHYHFVSVADYEQMVANGEFVEHAQVFDHFYGTSHAAITTKLSAGFDVLLDIDWQGARQVRDGFPGCCSIFIIPPSLEALRKRLERRGQDNARIIERRMRDAQAEISHWAEFDHVLINDEFDKALEQLHEIINDHRQQNPRKTDNESRRLAQLLASS